MNNLQDWGRRRVEPSKESLYIQLKRIKGQIIFLVIYINTLSKSIH